jgi:hypothetical protein
VQRGPRCALLLRDLLKATPGWHSGSAFIEMSAISIEAINKGIDELSRHVMTYDKIQHLKVRLPELRGLEWEKFAMNTRPNSPGRRVKKVSIHQREGAGHLLLGGDK